MRRVPLKRGGPRRCFLALLASLAVLVGAFLPGCGESVTVDMTQPTVGPIRESFSEPARTRLDETHVITMPVEGTIERILLEPGDAVTKGQELVAYDLVPLRKEVEEAEAVVAELRARLELNAYDAIESTLKVETETTIEAAEQALKAADAQVDAERARVARADKELRRMETLAAQGDAAPVTQSELDDVRLSAETATIELRRQEFYRAALNALFVAVKLGPKYIDQYLGRKRLDRRILEQQLVQSEARLELARHRLGLAEIRSPIDGVVLERHEQGSGPLPAGKPLLLLGDLRRREVIAEVLTQDVIGIQVGSPVHLTYGTRQELFEGKVHRIEPAGFTELSALGVEQQRVQVIVKSEEIPTRIGVGYRVQAEFITGRKEEALTVPRFSVLQDPDQSYYVLKVVEGRIRRQPVKVGLRSQLLLEILEGLDAGDSIVARPDATLQEGARVTLRRSD